MVFSTIMFLFRFLPITLALYYLAPPKLKNTVLFICSLVFYCWGEVRFFPVMLSLILLNYVCGLAIQHFDQRPGLRRFFLIAALVGSLGMLFYFKYANFVLESANALLGTSFAPIQGIQVLPLGISFYTFQTLSYSIDVYRRDVPAERNIIDFGAYVVMFPQLIAGPIVKYRDVSNQLHVYKGRYCASQIEEGMTLFTFGLAKKVLLADAIGALWTDIIGIADSPSTTFVGLANASTPLVWLGILAYSLQLYFDFSGYSMMGIGMGKMLGFDFPQNFNYPYIAKSVTEFWRRWHISLSTCGLVPGIDRLAQHKLQLTLSVSLHAPNDQIRSGMMPVNNAYPVDQLIKAVRRYQDTTGRRVSFEYSMVRGVNDSDECAKQLADLIRGMGAHVNLIPINPVDGSPYSATDAANVRRFQHKLETLGVNAVRRRLGSEISAACGQLRRDEMTGKA